MFVFKLLSMKNKTKASLPVILLLLLFAGNFLYRKYQIYQDIQVLTPEQMSQKYGQK